MHAPRSLFVVGLPRSLTSAVVEACAARLGLGLPRWTSSGEVLNPERWVFAPVRGEVNPGPRFTPPEQVAQSEQLRAFLDDLVAPSGRLYKDVVQPFVATAWLASRELPVLHVRRPLVDIAVAMERRGWLYPAAAAPAGVESSTDRFLLGLLRARRALDALSARQTVTLSIDDAARGPSAFEDACQELARRIGLAAPRPGAPWQADPERIAKLRALPRWGEIAGRLDELAAGSA